MESIRLLQSKTHLLVSQTLYLIKGDWTVTKIDTSLTKEEKYLVSLVAQGKSNKEISKLFFISDQTIKSHLTKLYKKLGLRSRSEVAMYAIKHNVI